MGSCCFTSKDKTINDDLRDSKNQVNNRNSNSESNIKRTTDDNPFKSI